MHTVAHKVIIMLLVVGVAALAGCDRHDAGSRPVIQPTGQAIGMTRYPPGARPMAPELAGPRLDGGHMQVSAFRGSVVVLNVWGSWCVPCREEAPVLQRVRDEFGSEEVQMVGVNTRDTRSGARRFVDEFDITYPNIADDDGQTLAEWREILPPQAVPSTVVIDRRGRVAARVLGAVTYDTLAQVINDVTEKRSPNP